MATQVSPTVGNKDMALGVSKSVVSTQAFNNEFYTYTTSMNSNFQTVGTFSLVSGASVSVCPANRVLHLTGRKLYPDVNPMNTFVGALSSPKFLVSVYDPISFLSGFIDPTSNTFAPFDQNLPNFFNLGRAGSNVAPSLGGQGALVTQPNALTAPLYNTGLPAVLVPYVTTTTGADVFMNVYTANFFGITIPTSSLTTLNLYARDPARPRDAFPSIPPGIYVTVYIVNGSGNTINAISAGGVFVLTSAIASFLTTKSVLVTFVSDGNRLLEVSRVGPF
jgi:hypothetical protein